MTTANKTSRFWTLLSQELNMSTHASRNDIVSMYLGEKATTLGNLLVRQVETRGHINRILVIGQTGVGKSSLINLLAGEPIAAVCDSAVGCTFDHTPIKIVRDGEIVEFIDTVGLNENSHGTVTDELATEKLLHFIRSNQRGFNLLLFVMKKGRIHEMFENNFRLFSSIVSSGTIPAILFISQCEDDNPLDAWLHDDATQRMLARYSFADKVCGTTKSGGRFAEKLQPLLEQTKHAVWNSILKSMLKEPIQIGDTRQLMDRIKQMWTDLWRTKQRSQVEPYRATTVDIVADQHTNAFWAFIFRIYNYFFPDSQQHEMRDVGGGYMSIEQRKRENYP